MVGRVCRVLRKDICNIFYIDVRILPLGTSASVQAIAKAMSDTQDEWSSPRTPERAERVEGLRVVMG